MPRDQQAAVAQQQRGGGGAGLPPGVAVGQGVQGGLGGAGPGSGRNSLQQDHINAANKIRYANMKNVSAQNAKRTSQLAQDIDDDWNAAFDPHMQVKMDRPILTDNSAKPALAPSSLPKDVYPQPNSQAVNRGIPGQGDSPRHVLNG